MPENLFDLSGHAAVVTGGNSGIGLGYARGLVGAGADVTIWGRDSDKNDRAVAELDGLGDGRVASLVCDVTDVDAIRDAMKASIEQFGRLDSCFANAGGGRLKPFLDWTIEDWDHVLSLDLTSVFSCFQEAARHMIERGGGGKLVVTGSVGTIFGMPGHLAYSAAKGGCEALVQSLAVELARNDIQVNTIQPGWIDTPMSAPGKAWEKFNQTIIHRTPAKRWGEPGDLEAVAVYLASPASRFHTGDTLRVDGGYSIF